MRRLLLVPLLALALVGCGEGPEDGDWYGEKMERACPGVIDWDVERTKTFSMKGSSAEVTTRTWTRKDGGKAILHEVPALTHDGTVVGEPKCDV